MPVIDVARADTDAEEVRLLALVAERSFRRGDFTLASGRKSNFYFNLKPTMMTAEGAYLCARAVLRRLEAEGGGVLGGLAMGAVPIVAAAAALSWAEGKPVTTFFVRKQAKEHGTRQTLEGLGLEETLGGRRAVIVEDVTTTGGSALQAVEAARAAGATVEAVITLLDRQEGAAEALAAHGLRLTSVLTAREVAGARA